MSQQIALSNRRALARFFVARKPFVAVSLRRATAPTDDVETVEGLVDFDALRREVARMKASRIDEAKDR